MTTLQTFKQFFKDNFVFTKIINPKEISDPIAQAIKDKEIPKTDLSVIAKPILNKLTDIQDAIELQEKQESFSVENIEQARTDMSEVVSVLQNILKKETEITVEPAKTDITIDISAIVKALDSLEKAIPIIKMPNIKDYSDELLKIVSAIESKKEVDYSKFFAKIEEILHNISNKETEEYPFKFDEFNRLKVNVDHWGGGGGGLNKEESDKLLTLATEETSSSIKDVLTQISNLTESIRKMTQSIQRPIYLSPTDGRLNISNITSLNSAGVNQIYMPTGFVANSNTASYMLTEGYDMAKSRWYLNTRSKI